ncbi:hypothetical protein ABLB37_22915 [Vibrio parahaemolyticus]|nr:MULTISPECIES: hypothetical protein [Vibrio]EFO35734.1 conserved hypothetical protein [Vibrio parahaemolyticus Peru-466]EFO49124.1 conserved hypothetical protein [Vibrio parahaemolyticus K5030]EVU10810.1 hypothetical protein D046_7912 [Vibrio parahaemolyticus V-223/04]ALG51955.1 hypothetical protein FORC6_1629 [Vibrio parahaemolyticus]ASC57166.1 hypothetical protein FORC37_1472 [Vibrio vulnificus]
MSDWEHLYDMQAQGYSADQIAEAAACGYNPYEIVLEDLGFSSEEWETIDNTHDTEQFEANPELIEVFINLVESARLYFKHTSRYLQIWGELGELYAEIKYGVKRHKPHTQGSDGKLGNDFIEIKTISPEKRTEEVKVKRAGNFNKLLIIKISSDLKFEGQFVARKDLAKGEGKHARAQWVQNQVRAQQVCNQTVITKAMTSSPEAKIYAALKYPTFLDSEFQNKLGLSKLDFTKAVNELSRSKKITRSKEDSDKWVRNTK